MNITDLIEYTPERIQLMKNMEKQGLDPNLVADPSISEEVANRIRTLALYNVNYTDSDKHWVEIKYQALMGKDVYVSDRKEKRNKITEWLGYTPDWDDDKYDIYEDYVSEEKTGFVYLVESGKLHYLNKPSGLFRNRNETIVRLHSYQCQELEQIMQSPYQGEVLYYLSEQEYMNTGRVSIILDNNYKITHKAMILDIYLETGLDVRLIPSIDVEKIYNKWYDGFNQKSNINLTNIMNSKFKPEEQQMYRMLSNKFREERQEKGLELSK